MNLNTSQLYDDYDAKHDDWKRGRTTRRRNSMENMNTIKRGQRLLHTQCLLHDVQLWKSLKQKEYEYDDNCRIETIAASFPKEKHDLKSDSSTNESDHSSYKGDTDEEMQYSDDNDDDDDVCSYDTISIDGKDQEHTILKNDCITPTTTERTVFPYALQIQIDLHKATNKSSETSVFLHKKYRKKILLVLLLIAFLLGSFFEIDASMFQFFWTMR